MTDVVTTDRPAKGKPKFILDPVRAAEAAKALVDGIRTMSGEADDELIADMIEGETDLFEIIDRLVGRIGEHAAFVRGLDAQIEDLKTRQERFEKRIAVDRALIEQAMVIAELPKIERPCATLSLSQRAAKLVIENPAEIPAAYWKAGDPKLDRDALSDAVKARAAEREARLADWRAEHGDDVPPPNDLPAAIPGARLETPPPSLTLRVR